MSARPISVGMLLAMTEAERAEAIRSLSPKVRRMLAHLASIGAGSAASKAVEHLDNGHERWALDRLDYARTHSHLAAALTAERDFVAEQDELRKQVRG